MSLLSEVLGRAKQEVINQTKDIENRAIGGVKAAPVQVVNTASKAVSDSVRTGIKAAVGSAVDLVNGNPDQALQRLVTAPSKMLDSGASALKEIMDIPGRTVDNVLSGLGITAGSVLRSPGLTGMNISSFMASGSSQINALEGALSRPDPMMNFLWYCEPPVLMADGVVATLPWYYVEEATVPFRVHETRTVYREGRNRQYASKYTVDGMTLTFYLDMGNNATSYLRAWQDLIISPFARTNDPVNAGGFRMPGIYKRDIPVILLDVNKKELVYFIYAGCWPTNIDALGLQSSSGERLTASVSFAVDDVFFDIRKVGTAQMDAALGKLSRPDFNFNGGPFTTTTSSDVQTFPITV